jgi:hypothetical protein
VTTNAARLGVMLGLLLSLESCWVILLTPEKGASIRGAATQPGTLTAGTWVALTAAAFCSYN